MGVVNYHNDETIPHSKLSLKKDPLDNTKKEEITDEFLSKSISEQK